MAGELFTAWSSRCRRTSSTAARIADTPITKASAAMEPIGWTGEMDGMSCRITTTRK